MLSVLSWLIFDHLGGVKRWGVNYAFVYQWCLVLYRQFFGH